MGYSGKKYNDNYRYESVNRNRFSWINGKIKEQFNNENATETK